MVRRNKTKKGVKLTNMPAVKKSTSDRVYEALHKAILSQELPGGTALIEAQLAAQFGVSKTPIREALQRLTHTGLVDFEVAKGATVHQLTRREIEDIWEMRILLEPLSLKQSAPRLTQPELDRLTHILDDAKAALEDGDYQQLSLLNSNFHETLYSKAINHLLIQWLESLSDRRRLISMLGWTGSSRVRDEWGEHRGILEAVQSGNFDLAAQRLEAHIRQFVQFLLEHLSLD